MQGDCFNSRVLSINQSINQYIFSTTNQTITSTALRNI
jgi:hypothetical protein